MESFINGEREREPKCFHKNIFEKKTVDMGHFICHLNEISGQKLSSFRRSKSHSRNEEHSVFQHTNSDQRKMLFSSSLVGREQKGI